MKKKVFAILLAMVVALAVMPLGVFATSSGVGFSGAVAPETLTYSESAQQVEVTIKTDSTINVDGVAMDLPYPAGWSIASITNETLKFRSSDVVLSLPSTENTGRVLWDSFTEFDGEDVPTTVLAVVTYNVPAGTAVGEYTLQATNLELTAGGGDIIEDEATISYVVKIVAAPVDPESVTVSPETAEVSVGGTQAYTAEVLPEEAYDKTVTWSSSDPSIATVDENGVVTGVAPGTATITATTVNGKTGSAQVTVTRSVEKPTAATGLVYNGEEQTGVAASEGYTVDYGTGTNAGDYTAIVTLAEGYKWADGSTDPLTLEWSIAPAEVAIPTAATGLVYNGEEQTGVEDGEEYDLIKNTGINAGDYEAVASLVSTNYIWEDGTTSDKSIEWSIAPAEVEIPTATTGLVYNGEEQTGVEAGEGYTLTDNTGTDAGSYVAVASLADPENYVWSDGTNGDQNIDWEIEQAELEDQTVELAVGGSKELDDDESLTYEAEENDVFELDGNTVTGTAAGEGEIIVSSDGSGNYKRGEAKITVKVTETPATGDKTIYWIASAFAALLVMAVYMISTKKKEQR